MCAVRKRIFLSPPHMGGYELKFVKEAFVSNYIAPLGPEMDAFEKAFSEYTAIEHCVALSSGTAAMHLALRGLGVGLGDEVFASTLTFVGSVSPIAFLGAKPVFIDCDRRSWNMDPVLLGESLEAYKKKGKCPKAVVPTDLYGQCADYEHIYEICDQYDVPVIVDAAEAMGARYLWDERSSQLKIKGSKFKFERHAGWGAKAALFSFNGNKIITTSGGGMLASDDEGFIEQARFLSQQAKDPAPHYEHSQIGYNYRMSNILAAIGHGQLRVLDKRVKRKREIFDYYQDALGDISGIEFMPEPERSRSNRWLTVILITPDEFGADREQVRLALEAANIESRPVWKPMHMQPVFRAIDENQSTDSADSTDYKKLKANKITKNTVKCKVVGGAVAEDLFERGLCLPSGTQLSTEDLDRIISIIKNCRKKLWTAKSFINGSYAQPSF
jgi:dTDP-4-amino-4,6-dideoxygalactose transaminase